MALFRQKNAFTPSPNDQRHLMESRYASARMNLLVAIVFTLINIVMTVLNTMTYFLFSIFAPYYITDLAWALCGKYPAEYYEGVEFESLPDSFLIFGIVISFIILAVYGLAWGLSKKRAGWLIAALVLFAIDTLFLLWVALDIGFANYIIDVIFHVWVLIYLILGVQAHFKLQTLPPEAEEPTPEEIFGTYGSTEDPYTSDKEDEPSDRGSEGNNDSSDTPDDPSDT